MELVAMDPTNEKTPAAKSDALAAQRADGAVVPPAAVVLAAGLGKRMRSSLVKVLHPLCGRPMIDHVVAALTEAGVGRIYVVVGHQGDAVRAHLAAEWGERVRCVDQPQPLGTGHAVLQAAPALADFRGDVIVTCGDTPLLRAETFVRLIEARRARSGAGIVLTADVPDPTGYGRIVRDGSGALVAIVEERDADDAVRRIREINVGTYCFDAPLLFDALRHVRNDNSQGEYYLTDVIRILLAEGRRFDALRMPEWTDMLGINSRAQLAEAAALMRRRLLRAWMDAGVTIVDPDSTHIDALVRLGADTVVEPFTLLKGRTVVGERCRIGPHAELIDARVGEGATVRHAIVERTVVPPGETVGPFVYLKPSS